MDKNVLAIDYGEARLGLALASTIARLPRPFKILPNDEKALDELAEIVDKQSIVTIVVGLPRNMSGQETAQTRTVRDFAKRLEEHVKLEVVLADESLSTQRAEQMRKTLKDRPAGAYIDDLAACFILEEHLRSSGEK